MSILEQGFEAQAKALRDFGYPDVTAEMVKAAYEKWVKGDDMEGVIEMFCAAAFDDHPQIFGKAP